MKTSVVVITGMVCGLYLAASASVWAGDLDSALESVTISTDAQGTTKNKGNPNNQPCTKDSGANCPVASDDNNVNTNAYQATTLQQTILNGSQANVTVNGAPATGGPQTNVLINGF